MPHARLMCMCVRTQGGEREREPVGNKSCANIARLRARERERESQVQPAQLQATMRSLKKHRVGGEKSCEVVDGEIERLGFD